MPIGGHGHVIYMGNLWGVFSCENPPEGRLETHISLFFAYKQLSGRNGDHFILCDLLSKVQKSHATNKEGSFKVIRPLLSLPTGGHGHVICMGDVITC